MTLIDVPLAAIALEALVLALLRDRTRLGARDLAGQILAGASLLLAVRFALEGRAEWALALVALSLPAHAFDVLQRIRAVRS